jgi:hypothetical protein
VNAARALARAEAAGLRLHLRPDGRVGMQAAAPPPADVLADLRRWREDVAHLLALRAACAGPPTETPASPSAARTPARAQTAGPDAWLASIARSIRAALADGAVVATDADGWLILIRPDGRRLTVSPTTVEQLRAAELLPDLPDAVRAGGGRRRRGRARRRAGCDPVRAPAAACRYAGARPLGRPAGGDEARAARSGAGAPLLLRGLGGSAAAEGELLLLLWRAALVDTGAPSEGRHHPVCALAVRGLSAGGWAAG